jgi:hypothetical protein
MKTVKVILFWAIGLSFIAIGILKYLNIDPVSGQALTRAHFPRWVFYAVATGEFIGGVLLLMTASTSRTVGSLLIAFLMLGAIGTRFILGDPFKLLLLPGLIFLIAILMSVRLRRKTEE